MDVRHDANKSEVKIGVNGQVVIRDAEVLNLLKTGGGREADDRHDAVSVGVAVAPGDY